jgi:hypothetical protein
MLYITAKEVVTKCAKAAMHIPLTFMMEKLITYCYEYSAALLAQPVATPAREPAF